MATAAGLHPGPFLDGFFMKEAAEFERWVDEQRTRCAQRAIEVMVELARTGALREAARYSDRLQRELGVAPDPEFERAVTRIRDLHTS